MIKFRLSGVRALLPLLFCASLLGLSGCDPIGSGSGPVRLVVNSPDGTVDAASGRVFQCLRTAVSATLVFDDGGAADFTQRVRWTSSNPDVVRVSNGDEPLPLPAVGFYTPGVLTPVAPGTSTVTATFSGFSDSIVITVGTPSSFFVQAKNPQTNIATDIPGGAMRIGPNTAIDLDVQAILDGATVNVDAAAAWAFVTPNTAVATIDPASGVIVGVAPGDPLTARVSFASCSSTVDTAITVAPITAITMVPPPALATDPLIVGNTQPFTVLADFGDGGPQQDISIQAVFTSTDTAVAAFNLVPGITNLLSSLTAGSASVSATFTVGKTDTAPGTVLPTQSVPITTVVDVLTGISMAPATPPRSRPAAT
ncbi:hypothetical protein [Nevskia sp.]|uniref:hypothetical protein n=1 Tax=Nevskia sp. TaxID=1929292 RepID=UPI0025CF68BD|nr:hypothetical protein [Nevskia sp.]